MRWIALPLICAAVAGVATTTATARRASLPSATTGATLPLATGIGDPIFQSSQASTAFAMANQAGATYARLWASWASIAPGALPTSGFNATDPTSPYYTWTALDASVSAANANGVTPILDIVSPPAWAYAVPPGTWTGGSPQIAALGAFATALAKHYNGAHPSAHVFSVWNEPNFNRNLYPQDPGYYRSMVNAVADSVHAVNASNLVVAGELAPFKHAPSKHDKNSVIPPLTFMRTMLCLQPSCNTPSKFDVWAHHPYSDTGPFGHAKVSGGVELGDLPKMNALLKSAENAGTIDSAHPVQFWATEVGWSSNPPNRKGVPMSLLQRWMPESMYQTWKSGATVSTWFLLQDLPSSTPFQSGLYFRSTSLANAQPKPLLDGFRFPVVAYLKSHGKVQIWGLDSTGDSRDVTIQSRKGAGGPWKTAGDIQSNSHGIFQATLPLKLTSKYWIRAVAQGSGESPPFSLKVPKNENLNVTPFPLAN